ncbi:hypothetical protein [Cylindrospermum sp. FACHB-282]|uniref:hypothetical protein n=1 Tax=Cylindrospermum sp. FACHB-282 TaxID=2692794 RepID=UPI001F555768|nr:hypothetical protein [Cylindrospermum sp. FACHB-282]
MSDRRFSRLQKYAAYADKTMTQVIDELIDSLPNIENGDSSSTPRPVKPMV